MSLSPLAIAQAGATLAERRRTGQQGPCLPATCRPHSFDDALAIQVSVLQALRDQVGAWKCGLPSDGKLVMAPIHARTVFTAYDVVCPVWSHAGQVRVEPELAFVMARDLPARDAPYTEAEVASAVGSVHLALELIDSRYATPTEAEEDAGLAPGFVDKLADGLVNQGLLLGPAVEKAEALAAATLRLDITAGGRALGHWQGAHPNGQPMAPLVWLVNALSSQGRGLRAHHAVITGSYAGALTVPLGQDLTVHFGHLGSLNARFKAL